jgi:hypothetical protein
MAGGWVGLKGKKEARLLLFEFLDTVLMGGMKG